MRSISFQLTTEQFKNRTKDVTRRLGWANLRPGDRLEGCVKCMGLKKGEKRERLGIVEVVSVVREPLAAIAAYPDDCRREGFPAFTPAEFVAMFARAQRCTPATLVTRIEFRYVNELTLPPAEHAAPAVETITRPV